MDDNYLVKLRIESVMTMKNGERKFSLVTLINDDEDKQLTFVCDSYVCDQIFMRDDLVDTQKSRLLPEILLSLLKSTRLMGTKNLRIVIYGVSEGEYDTALEDLNASLSFSIRLGDAVWLSKISNIPIYIDSYVLKMQATPFSKDDIYTRSMPINILPDEQLRQSLQTAINEEDYRLAQVLSNELKKRKK